MFQTRGNSSLCVCYSVSHDSHFGSLCLAVWGPAVLSRLPLMSMYANRLHAIEASRQSLYVTWAIGSASNLPSQSRACVYIAAQYSSSSWPMPLSEARFSTVSISPIRITLSILVQVSQSQSSTRSMFCHTKSTRQTQPRSPAEHT